MKLTIELIPRTSWGKNVRSQVSKSRWDTLRRTCYAAANNRCEICGKESRGLHCHEVWEYNDSKHIQTLIGLQALCYACHQVKHIGMTTYDVYPLALRHMAKVNSISVPEAHEAVECALDLWKQRSKHRWHIDITYLETLE